MNIDVAEATFTATTTMSSLLPSPRPPPHPLPAAALIKMDEPRLTIMLIKGGVQSMVWVITLVLIALGFGGILEQSRCLEAVLGNILKIAETRFGLISASVVSVGTNVVTGDVYLSIAYSERS